MIENTDYNNMIWFSQGVFEVPRYVLVFRVRAGPKLGLAGWQLSLNQRRQTTDLENGDRNEGEGEGGGTTDEVATWDASGGGETEEEDSRVVASEANTIQKGGGGYILHSHPNCPP